MAGTKACVMNKGDIAAIFDEMADILDTLGEDPFRVNSYRRAARVLRDTTADLAALAAEGKLTVLPGVGKSTAEKIAEYLKTGHVTRHEELRAKVPAGLLELLRVQGLGPKTAGKLWHEAKITSLEELREALDKDPRRLLGIEGLGEKKLALMREALQFAEATVGRFLLHQAQRLAEDLLAAVGAARGVRRAEAAGSLRRRRETIGDIDIVCQADAKHAQAAMDAFAAAPGVQKTIARGETKCSVVLPGPFQADLRIVPEESYGAALAYFTGSKAHNVALRTLALKHKLHLNEYGLFVQAGGGKTGRRLAGQDEEGIYKALKLAWIPPELREDRGEIGAAAAGKLPHLIEPGDIRGDLQMHTTASDGANTIEEMVRACRDAGYKYLAITDHSRSQRQANGLDEKRLRAHAAAIRAAAKKFPDMLVLAGVEVDILKDGTLDFADEVLRELDFVMASPHAALNQGRQEATRRLIRAIENPCVHALGHPSGRLLNQRPGMEIDIEPIARAATARNVALEINADPHRLDLRDVHVKAAIDAGAKLVISTDAHRAGDLAVMTYGVSTARRGWASAANVVNTFTPQALKKWLAR